MFLVINEEFIIRKSEVDVVHADNAGGLVFYTHGGRRLLRVTPEFTTTEEAISAVAMELYEEIVSSIDI